MHVDISYLRNKQVIGSAILYQGEKEKEVNLQNLKSIIQKFICENGFYYAHISFIEDTKKENNSRAIVDNCSPVKVNKVFLYNINIVEPIDLAKLCREINYEYRDKELTQELIQEITEKIHDLLQEHFFIVKNIRTTVILNNKSENKCDIVCTAYIGEVTTNYVLNVKSNTDIYFDKIKADLEKKYNEFFSQEKLSFNHLKSLLDIYLHSNTYIKKIDILLQDDQSGKFIIDNILYVSIMSYLSFYNSELICKDINEKLCLKNSVMLDGNILNKLYYRIICSLNRLFIGANLRYKLSIGYKKTLYLGCNLYYPPHLEYSDISAIMKIKHNISKIFTFIGRINLRYYMLANNKIFHLGGLVGGRMNDITIILSILDIINIIHHNIGIKVMWKDKKRNIKFVGHLGTLIIPVGPDYNYDYYPFMLVSINFKKYYFSVQILSDYGIENKLSDIVNKLIVKAQIGSKITKYLDLFLALIYKYNDSKFGAVPGLRIHII